MRWIARLPDGYDLYSKDLEDLISILNDALNKGDKIVINRISFKGSRHNKKKKLVEYMDYKLELEIL